MILDHDFPIPPVDEAELPEHYRGQVALVIEIGDAPAIKINGVEFSPEDGRALIEALRGG